jgi:hypothetical protein
MYRGGLTMRLGPLGAGLAGAMIGWLGTALIVLLMDHLLPILAGIPTPAPWMVSSGLVLAAVSMPGAAMYLAGQLALPRATRIAHLAVAMALALTLVVGGWALCLAMLSHAARV